MVGAAAAASMRRCSAVLRCGVGVLDRSAASVGFGLAVVVVRRCCGVAAVGSAA